MSGRLRRRAGRAAAGLLLTLALAAGIAHAQEILPRVHVIATGGTIASTGGARLTGQELVRSLPGVEHAGMTPRQSRALRRAAQQGVHVVVSSRTGGGCVPAARSGASSAPQPGEGATLGAGDLIPQKVRILPTLAQTRTRDPAGIAEIFHRN